MLKARGMTLIELMVALCIAAVLASLAYPGFAQTSLRARRGEAVTQLLQVQQAQERWRANEPRYAALHELDLAAVAADSAYRLAVTAYGPTGFVAEAEALGWQASDAPCRFLRLTMNAGHTEFASGKGPDENNDAAANRRCWNR